MDGFQEGYFDWEELHKDERRRAECVDAELSQARAQMHKVVDVERIIADNVLGTFLRLLREEHDK